MRSRVRFMNGRLPISPQSGHRAWGLIVPLLGATAPSAAQAAHVADHLVLSEIGYDAAIEQSGKPSGEYVEIHNPTDQDISLNDGAQPGSATDAGSYFFSDAPKDYYKVVNGTVALSTTTDAILQFPAGSVIPAHGTIVICSDSTVFLDAYFGGSLALFTGQPGSPQLFETTQDGSQDGVEDMIFRSNYGGTSVTYMNLTNSGEPAILFHWDGHSDLIEDVDIVVWKTSSSATPDVIDKDSTASTGIDGPDDGTEVSYYLSDAAQTSSLGAKYSGSADTASLQRRGIIEVNETDSGGNGLSGHDETSEEWGSSASDTWGYQKYTPGAALVEISSDSKNSPKSVTGALSFLAPVAVSSADGPNGESSPQDYGADGTLTELYLTSVDTDFDRVADSLFVAVRGSMFGEPDDSSNSTFVLFDLDPGTDTGVTTLAGVDNELSDVTGTLDAELTNAGFALDTGRYDSVGYDGAVGLTVASPTSSDTAGWRTFGTGGSTGLKSNFAYNGAYTDVDFDGDISALYPAASGASFAAGDGVAALLSYNTLAGHVPDYIFVTAVTTAGNGANASPNTLPESTGDDLSTYPQVIDQGVCFSTATGEAVTFYIDADLDGYGTTTATSYCGPVKPGYSLESTDCNDGDITVAPGHAELCDGLDNDCDGETDEDVLITYYEDGDGDGFGDPTLTTEACAPPEGYSAIGGDCDDIDPDVNPAAEEVCDDIDNDCDGTIDDPNDVEYYDQYADGDGDGYGTGAAVNDCLLLDGYVLEDGDCNDADVTSYPGATEQCDGNDNDCDGVVPDDESDNDGDSYRVCEGDCDDTDTEAGKFSYPGAFEYCDGIDNDCDGSLPEDEADADGDGQAYCEGDCDDSDAGTHDGAVEYCDAKDNNCDSEIDEGVTTTYYVDNDGDSFGGESSIQACSQPDGYAGNADDCNDSDATINPAASESCDTIDNNCDGNIDEGLTTTYYGDADGDGHGGDATTEACSQPAGYAASSDDCDDAQAATYPGATEACDGVDNDCDDEVPAVETDSDGDGQSSCAGDCIDGDASVYTGATELCNGADDDCSGAPGDDEMDHDGDGFSSCGGDCDDEDDTVNPAAAEICDEGIDNDCNPDTDEVVDGDEDGYSTCDGDCDDAETTVHPGAEEVCDGVDNDCDTDTDENTDGDGDAVSICDGDCDDADGAVYPDATEVCNGVDDNCDGTTDEGFESDVDQDGYTGTDCAGDDCNDGDASINPGTDDEPDDGIDQDCSGSDAVDADDDGYTSDEDCNDNDADVHPGQAEAECGDGLDNDCDGAADYDDADCTTSDADDDGLSYEEEQQLGTDPANPDTDSDGLTDGEEVNTHGTNPLTADTDGGGVSDGDEVAAQTNPLDASDDAVTGDDDDSTAGDDDTTSGDDDTTSGDDDTTSGDDDTTSGDDDTTSGDDDTTSGDDDTPSGDDDTTSGDDDTTSGDDDNSGGDDDGDGCSCSTPEGSRPMPAGTLLVGLLAAGILASRRRR